MVPSDPLVAASARPIILSFVRSGESCGYRILQRACLVSGGQTKWSRAGSKRAKIICARYRFKCK